MTDDEDTVTLMKLNVSLTLTRTFFFEPICDVSLNLTKSCLCPNLTEP